MRRKITIEVPDDCCECKFAMINLDMNIEIGMCVIFRKHIFWPNEKNVKPCQSCLDATIKEGK